MFQASTEKTFEKIIDCLEKDKIEKVGKLLIKNRDNAELFDMLLEDIRFTDVYLVLTPDEDVIQKLSFPIQKKIIEVQPHILMFASDEIRNDRMYMEELQHKLDTHQIENKHNVSVYDCLGSELANNKDYILGIQDKDPRSFVRATKRIQFDDETLKAFFDRYPDYVSELPDNLKYNYEYVESLIKKIPSEYIGICCGQMDYDYLKNEQIKQAFINSAGEKVYNQLLISSLANDESQLKKIDPNEFRKLILVEPTSFFYVDGFQALFSIGKQKDNINLIQKINKVAKLLHRDVDTPRKLTVELYELSNAIGDGLTYETILGQVNQYWSQIEAWISEIDEFHKLDDGTISRTEHPKSFYNLYNLLIGIENNKLEDMFKVFYNSELRTSFYAEGIKNITVTDENLFFLQLSCNCNLFNSDAKSIDVYNKLFLRMNGLNNDPYATLEFIDDISKNHRLNDLIINSNIDSLDNDLLINLFGYVSSSMSNIYKIENLEELRDYDKFMDNNINKFSPNTLVNYKDYALLKYFQINLTQAENIVHSYLSANNDSALYKKMPETMYLKESLEKIIKSGSIKEIKDIDASLEKQDIKISFKDIYKIIDNIKKNYGNELNSSLLQVNATNGVIDATNLDFNLLVHVIGAYGAVPTGDIYESWNTKEKSSTVSICTSFISDNNMGIAPTNEHSVVLGFNNLPDDFLEIMSSNDMISDGFKAKKSSRFLNPEELKNITRHGHNEIVIRRRKGEFTEEKVEPSYIICFDNINEESKIASEKFGVPIIFIDREKVAERHHNEIVSMVEQFKTDLNPHLISKIICEQENNKAGLRLVRPDLVEKYFSTDFRQKNIDELYSIISNGLQNNNVNSITAMNEFVKAVEKEVDKFKVTKEVPFRKNTFDIKYEEFISIFKSNPNFKEDFELQPELTPEELYERFIECREKLSMSESMELQYIKNNSMSIDQEQIGSMKVS